jgi:hypothetical protein
MKGFTMQRQRMQPTPITLYNRLNNEKITGELINNDEIEGKQFYVVKVNSRVLRFAKDAYSPKRMFLTR